jgi:type III secretion system (T3SS) inner membrane Yop/YscD-like protein
VPREPNARQSLPSCYDDQMALPVGAFPCNGLILIPHTTAPLRARFPLEGERITIGSANGNSVVVPDPAVSRHHFELHRTADGWTLVDLHSRDIPERVGSSPIIAACTSSTTQRRDR